MSFQTFGGNWFYSKNAKIECRFITPLETIHFPKFDCSGDITKDLSSICKGSMECKNHEDIIIQIPVVICKSEKDCGDINPIDCLHGPSSSYRNKELRNMLPEQSLLPPKEVIRVIEEI